MNYQGENSEKYDLNFGDGESMPSCSCMNFKRTDYPCKHFFAVFRKYPCWGWSALSLVYINSRFLTLDNLSDSSQNEGNGENLDILTGSITVGNCNVKCEERSRRYVTG